jgi:phosphoserine aminotransferase
MHNKANYFVFTCQGGARAEIDEASLSLCCECVAALRLRLPYAN